MGFEREDRKEVQPRERGLADGLRKAMNNSGLAEAGATKGESGDPGFILE